MNLSILEKLQVIINFFTSSFLGIELFLVVLLFSLFLFFNLKYDNKYVKIGSILFLLLVFFIVNVLHNTYILKSIKSFTKTIMYYYYFPNMALYYIIVVVVTAVFMYTIVSKEISKIKKIINYIFFILIYLCFMGVLGYVGLNNIKLVLNDTMYKYDTLLSFVQISNLLTLLWIIITFFYYLYKYFKNKYD